MERELLKYHNLNSVRFAWVAAFGLIGVLLFGTIFYPLETFLLSAFSAACLLIYAEPLVGLVLATLLSYLHNMLVLTINGTAFPLVAFFIVPIYIILLPKLLKSLQFNDKYINNILLIMFFLWGWASLSAFWSHGETGKAAILFFSNMLLFQIFFIIKDKKTLFRMLYCFISIGVMLGGLLIISKWRSAYEHAINVASNVTLTFRFLGGEKRPSGFEYANEASLLMNVFLFFGIGLLYANNLIRRILIGLACCFFVICCAYTSSKMGMLNLIWGSLVIIFTIPFFNKVRFRLFMIFAAAILFLLLTIGYSVLERASLTIGTDVVTRTNRLLIWSYGFEKFADTDGLGLGIGGLVMPGSKSSFYLSMIYDLGFVGFSFFLVALILLIHYIKNTLTVCSDGVMIFLVYCVIAALITLSVHSAVEVDYLYSLFWVTISLAITTLKVAYNSGRGINEEGHVRAHM